MHLQLTINMFLTVKRSFFKYVCLALHIYSCILIRTHERTSVSKKDGIRTHFFVPSRSLGPVKQQKPKTTVEKSCIQRKTCNETQTRASKTELLSINTTHDTFTSPRHFIVWYNRSHSRDQESNQQQQFVVGV